MNKTYIRTEASSSAGRGKVSLSLSLEFESQRAHLSPPRCLTCLLGLQGVQWIRGLIVVRVSWPGYPGLPKKKKKCNVPLLLTDAREIKESMPQVNAQKLLLLLLFGFCSVKKGKERSLREQK
jgi:hypothetical protein